LRIITSIYKVKNPKLLFWSGIIGNVLDHYDSALYAFLAPFLAPIFFPDTDPVVALIMIYGLKSTSMITRPLGAMFFGKLAVKYQIKNILALTLSGVAICTFLIGIIPTYADIGVLAPIILTFIRSLQGFFAAGEHSIAAFFIIQLNKNENKQGRSSSYYLCSTMAGSLLASLAATIISFSSNPLFYWRFAFMLGLLTAIVGVLIRIIAMPSGDLKLSSNPILEKSLNLIGNNKYKLFKIIIICSFSFLTYSLPFIFLNNFIPLVSNVKTSALLAHNTVLMAVNLLLLPVFGAVIDRFDHARWMATLAFLLAITIIPIFYLLPHLSIMQISIAKLWIVVLGVAFVTPLYALLFKMIKGEEKYLVTGLGYSIGTDILGRNLPVICFALWHSTSKLWAPALYIAFVSLITFVVLLKTDRKQLLIN